MAKRILVIDDEKEFREIMMEWLTHEGYEVEVAVDGLDGMEKVEKAKPDLILLDLQMPVMDGAEFYKIIKSNKKHYDIPIVIITARTTAQDRVEVVGGDLFVTKPVSFETLKESIDTLTKG